MPALAQPDVQSARRTLVDDYQRIRKDSEQICAPLKTDDYCVQTMPDVSPAKWHLAHTSWFFETFILLPFLDNYRCFDSYYDHLFNSYYITHGQPFSRPARGLLSRPTVEQIYRYRAAVDEAMQTLLANAAVTSRPQIEQLVILGLNHEQQHQEHIHHDGKASDDKDILPIEFPEGSSKDRSYKTADIDYHVEDAKPDGGIFIIGDPRYCGSNDGLEKGCPGSNKQEGKEDAYI